MKITYEDIAKFYYNDEFENLPEKAQKFCLDNQFEIQGEFSPSELKLVLKPKHITCFCGAISFVIDPFLFYKLPYPYKLKEIKPTPVNWDYHTDKILISPSEAFALQSLIYVCCFCGRPLEKLFQCVFCQIDFTIKNIKWR